METMTIETKITITNDAIESMLVTAIEGGIDYWGTFDDKELKDAKVWLQRQIEKGLLKRNESVHYMWMDAMFQGYPFPIRVYDVEEVYSIEEDEEWDDLESIGYLSMETIKKGLEKASIEYPNRFRQFFPEYDNGDVVDADVLFQMITLDDIVYG
jgi:hypothetical protein